MISARARSSSGDDDEQNHSEVAGGRAPVGTQDEDLSRPGTRDEGTSARFAAGGVRRARLATDRMENRLHQPARTTGTQNGRAVSGAAVLRTAVQLRPASPDRGR